MMAYVLIFWERWHGNSIKDIKNSGLLCQVLLSVEKQLKITTVHTVIISIFTWMNQLENEPLFQNDGTFSFWLFVMPVIHAAMWVMVQPKGAGFQKMEPEGFISLFWKSSFKKKKSSLSPRSAWQMEIRHQGPRQVKLDKPAAGELGKRE